MSYGYTLQEETQREYEESVQWYVEGSEQAALLFTITKEIQRNAIEKKKFLKRKLRQSIHFSLHAII